MSTPPDLLPMSGRRHFLQTTGLLAAVAAIPSSLLASSQCAPPIPKGPSNGGSCPYPIPWLDKNGSHNQAPNSKASIELSHIFHFKGKLARCSGFTGIGTDNKGNRLPFGTPTTDYSFMSGEYWAARQPQQGTFAHT